MKNSMPFLTALLLLLASAAQGQGLIVTDQPVADLPDRRFLPRPPRPIDRFLPIEIRESDIKTQISGQFAATTITQTLYNPSRRSVQGFFLFPVPKDSRIDSFSMEIDGELTEGELLDAKKARKIYEDIVRRTLDPALFEYCSQGLFKIRIFPFEPCKTKQIRFRYTQLLPKDGNLISYNLPLKQRQHCLAPGDKTGAKFSLDISLAAPRRTRFKTVYSPSHDIAIDYEKGKGAASVKLSNPKESPVADFQLVFSTSSLNEEKTPVSAEFFTYFEEPGSKDGHFLLLISPQVWRGDTERKIQPKDVVFVLDSSASMRHGKLEKAKEGLVFCLDSLNPNDRFQVVRFSTDTETLFTSLVLATKKNVKKAGKFAGEIKAIGGTAVEEALTVAVDSLAGTPNKDNRPRQIVFITDGQPTLGETDEKRLVAEVERRLQEVREKARVFSFGIGEKINTHLLDLLARETRGHAQFALPAEDIELKISRFYSRFAEPVFSDLTLKIEGAERIQARTPKFLPDVFRGDQLVVLGQLKKQSDVGKVVVKGRFLGENKTITFPVAFSHKGKSLQFIPRLWAVRRVGWLLEQIRLNGASAELKDEVTALARQYAIVTPYTSWLILEDEARRNVPMTNRSLRDIETAPMTRSTLEGAADAFSQRKSGGDALASAASEADLKRAQNIAAQSRAMHRSKLPLSGRAPNLQVEPQSCLINGKSFYLNSGQWIDSAAQSLSPDAPVRQIKFASDSYFAFLDKHPAASKWFAAGANLRLAITDSEIIEIIH